jgi:hypothetical protein
MDHLSQGCPGFVGERKEIFPGLSQGVGVIGVEHLLGCATEKGNASTSLDYNYSYLELIENRKSLFVGPSQPLIHPGQLLIHLLERKFLIRTPRGFSLSRRLAFPGLWHIRDSSIFYLTARCGQWSITVFPSLLIFDGGKKPGDPGEFLRRPGADLIQY